MTNVPKYHATVQADGIRDDQPIKSTKEDILSRGPLVKRLTDLVFHTRSKMPLTIAINAPWGFGKSSFLNLLKKSIQQRNRKNSNKIEIIQFNPWHCNSIDDLVRTMFTRLSVGIGKSSPRAIKSKEMISKLLNGIGDSQIVMPGWVSVIVRVLGHELSSHKPLDDLREELDKYLSNQRRRLVVLIDDVDRLEPDALRTLFRMLRLVADFPNITYILAYDREVVEKFLEDARIVKNTNYAGSRNFAASHYLEKIIQLSIDLPPPELSRVHDLLESEMKAHIQSITARQIDDYQWAKMMHSGLLQHFRSIRQVKRYMNGLVATLPMLSEEVDLLDFLAIELIRTFHPIVYRKLAIAKDIVVSKNRGETDNEKRMEEVKEFSDNLCTMSSNNMDQALREILQELFPEIKTAYDPGWAYRGPQEAWRQDGRVCAAGNFDKFFLLAIPQGQISEVMVRSIINNLGDQNLTTKTFCEAISQGTALKILRRIHDYREIIPGERLHMLVQILFELGDEIESCRQGSSFLSHISVPFFVSQFLNQMSQDFSVQETLLSQGVIEGKSLWTIAGAVMYCTKNDEASSRQENLELRNQIRRMTADRIQKQASDGSLWTIDKPSNSLFLLLEAWHLWGNKDEVKSYIKSWIEDDENLLKLLQHFVFETGIPISSGKVVSTKECINVDVLGKFVDLKAIKDRLKRIAQDSGKKGNQAKKIIEMPSNPLDLANSYFRS